MDEELKAQVQAAINKADTALTELNQAATAVEEAKFKLDSVAQEDPSANPALTSMSTAYETVNQASAQIEAAKAEGEALLTEP